MIVWEMDPDPLDWVVMDPDPLDWVVMDPDPLDSEEMDPDPLDYVDGSGSMRLSGFGVGFGWSFHGFWIRI